MHIFRRCASFSLSLINKGKDGCPLIQEFGKRQIKTLLLKFLYAIFALILQKSCTFVTENDAHLRKMYIIFLSGISMNEQANVFPQVSATKGVGEAVGVPNRKWFVAFVGHNTEKACRDRLQKLGYEAFVASQEEEHHWANGRKRRIERILISTIIFVRVSEAERRTIVKLPYIHAFLTDKAGLPNAAGIRPLAVIPDRQMEMLRFMLYQSDRPVEFVSAPLSVGDQIQVLRGAMAGLVGEIVTLASGGEPRIGVRIKYLGYAILHVSPEDVEKLTA